MLEQRTRGAGGRGRVGRGGAVRDELLGRRARRPRHRGARAKRAARALREARGGAPFALSERHGAWRVALDGGRTVDFTPLPGSIEDDLATRDFTINAIARPLAGGEPVDPFNGAEDLDAPRCARSARPSSRTIPSGCCARCARGRARLRLDAETERLVRDARGTSSRARPASGSSQELRRLSPQGYGRLDELGLLEPLGGRLDERLEPLRLAGLPARGASSARTSRASRSRTSCAASRARSSAPSTPRRCPARSTASAARRSRGLSRRLPSSSRRARGRRRAGAAHEPAEPLVRGEELGLPPGPEIGRLLAEIEEERAAGTIATREEALDYARRNARAVREDG